MSDSFPPAVAAVHCVCFLLLRDGHVLLERRRQDKAVDPGLIMVPGGHMEAGETHLQTLLREVREELGIEPVNVAYVCSLLHPTTELQLLHYYRVTSWQGEPVALEAEELIWFPLERLDELHLSPDDVAVREAIRLYGLA